MTYQTHDPYLQRHDARLEQQDATGARFPTTRSNTGTAIGLAVALALLVGLGVMLSLGPDATTTPVDAPDGPAVTQPMAQDGTVPAPADPAANPDNTITPAAPEAAAPAAPAATE
ncbi:hypothetical protein JYP51_07035 [Ponticoccus gilvus]|nr:hypothetical protein [Enemella evansiae]